MPGQSPAWCPDNCGKSGGWGFLKAASNGGKTADGSFAVAPGRQSRAGAFSQAVRDCFCREYNRRGRQGQSSHGIIHETRWNFIIRLNTSQPGVLSTPSAIASKVSKAIDKDGIGVLIDSIANIIRASHMCGRGRTRRANS